MDVDAPHLVIAIKKEREFFISIIDKWLCVGCKYFAMDDKSIIASYGKPQKSCIHSFKTISCKDIEGNRKWIIHDTNIEYFDDVIA